MIIVGVPFINKRLSTMEEISGGGDGKRALSENELGIADFQGQHVAEITAKLAAAH